MTNYLEVLPITTPAHSSQTNAVTHVIARNCYWMCEPDAYVADRHDMKTTNYPSGTASEAVVVALLAARSRSLEGRPPADMAKLVVYTSDQVC